MTDRRDDTPRADEGLDEAIAPVTIDAAGELEHRMARHVVQRDFADVVARARTLDPSRLSQTEADRAAARVRVIELRPERDSARHTRLQADVAVLAKAAREHLDQQITQRNVDRPLPGLPDPWRERRPWRAAAAIAAIAAAVALSWVGARELTQATDSPRYPQASEFQNTNPGSESVTVREPNGATARREPAAAPNPSEVDEPEPTPATAEESEPDRSEARTERPRPQKRERVSAEDRLRALDERAQARWRAGDVLGAERDFLTIIRTDRQGRFAELAFAELFAIAGSSPRSQRAIRLWREYLERFPRGRFADDARAGLCRTSSRQASCWEAYLHDFPRGSYREEARASLPEDSSGEP